MATNFYFQNGDTSGTTSEQRLVESLVIESLKIYGHDVFYLPRTLVNRDTIFDEDALSKFTQSYPLEMYLENVEGFEGEGDIFSKFGIEIRDSATFVLAKKRWEDLVDTSGGTFQLEARPAEGDLLYFAKTGSLFEIKFVEFQNPFYQLGKIYVFRLQCELFEYSSEALDTGNTEIDVIEDNNSLDTFLYQLKTETGDNLLTETRDSLIKEDYATNKTNANTDNADFMNFSDILDFTEVNPFGEVG
tara:strand:+ start:1780 stop:2517 length:738 start_codon:yes stop_codon:yes gene_type:complete